MTDIQRLKKKHPSVKQNLSEIRALHRYTLLINQKKLLLFNFL
ncbi:hypothetical protein M595_4887 [Lyngbya aestuarii BL J]|uniref:Uncharacterized protein n=1 Tax=Lyngbya aestuarii BL J TaxID=1348334 RepID=U7QFE0_9CYAN|nr:hypothetical protein M595_4887 [Lyngbya aestuarii BL J]